MDVKFVVWILGAIIALLGGTQAEGLVVRSIYYVEDGGIYRADSNGNGGTLVFPSSAGVIRVDNVNGYIYWSRQSGLSKEILRGRPDGSGVEVVLTGDSSMSWSFVVDYENEVLFFAADRAIKKLDLVTGEILVMVQSSLYLHSSGVSFWIDESNELLYFGNAGLYRCSTQLVGGDFINGPSDGSIESFFSDNPEFNPLVDRFSSGFYGIEVMPTDDQTLKRYSLEGEETDSWPLNIPSWGLTNPMVELLGRPYYLDPDGALYVYAYFGEEPGHGLVRLNRTASGYAFDRIFVRGLRAFDLIDPANVDTVAPEITLVAPSAGTTSNQITELAGIATDNLDQLLPVSWQLNGEDQGILALAGDGSFGTTGITLSPGENVIRVTARDLDGNEKSTEVTVTWVPSRNLGLGSLSEQSEGRLVSVPITLSSSGRVSGMTFELSYEADYLGSPLFIEEAALEGSAVAWGNPSPGVMRVTFARAGTTFLSGDQLLGQAQFRIRSVPNDLSTSLNLTIIDVSGSDGSPIVIGNSTSGTTLPIRRRVYLGDINTNGKLDVGDAYLMQRLLAGIEETRAWDHELNDLNGTATLDSGDVVNVLRTVIGVLPQPGGEMLMALALRVVEETPRAFLTVDNATPAIGETITVGVQIEGLESDISGVSFVIDYPEEALRLESASSYEAGSLVGGGSFTLWEVSPENNFENQSGQVSFAASRSTLWEGSSAGGNLALLRFRVQSTLGNQVAWPIVLRSVAVPGPDGYTIIEPSGDQVEVISQRYTYLQWAETQFSELELNDMTISGWLADPDGDEITNGQEYFQGSGALEGKPHEFLGGIFEKSGGEEVPVIVIERSMSATESVYEFEMSTDLKKWDRVASREYYRSSGELGREQVLIGPNEVPVTWAQLFFRLVFPEPGSDL